MTREGKKHYNEIKKFVLSNLEFSGQIKNFNPEATIYDCLVPTLNMVSFCVQKEDYEGAQATKDAIMEFLNQFLSEEDRIKVSDTFKLPDYKHEDIRGIVCDCSNHI